MEREEVSPKRVIAEDNFFKKSKKKVPVSVVFIKSVIRTARVHHVDIGSNVLFGPFVQIYTATHPTSAAERRKGLEFAKPISIGSDVWVGGSAIINPGVTIGEGSVIGAGSVVTRPIPADVFAAGNPCRVIRGLNPD